MAVIVTWYSVFMLNSQYLENEIESLNRNYLS